MILNIIEIILQMIGYFFYRFLFGKDKADELWKNIGDFYYFLPMLGLVAIFCLFLVIFLISYT